MGIIPNPSQFVKSKLRPEVSGAHFIIRDYGFAAVALQGRGSVLARFPETAGPRVDGLQFRCFR